MEQFGFPKVPEVVEIRYTEDYVGGVLRISKRLKKSIKALPFMRMSSNVMKVMFFISLIYSIRDMSRSESNDIRHFKSCKCPSLYILMIRGAVSFVTHNVRSSVR